MEIVKVLKFTQIYGLNLCSDNTQIWYKDRVKITIELSHKIHLWFLLLKQPTIWDSKNSKTYVKRPKFMLKILILV